MKSSDTTSLNEVTFRFRNIGPIADAELQLGDLTLIAGRNNTGKTYISYTLYGFLVMWERHVASMRMAPLRHGRYTPRNPRSPTSARRDSVLIRIAKQLAKEGEASLPVDHHVLSAERNNIMADFSDSFSYSSIAGIFSAPPRAFENSSLEVDFNTKHAGELFLNRVPTDEDDAYAIHYDGKSLTVLDFGEREPSGNIRIVASRLMRLYHQFLFPEMQLTPFVLSSERFGISLFYKELDLARNRLVDTLQKGVLDKGIGRYELIKLITGESSRYALPIQDNITFTRNISELSESEGDTYKAGLFTQIAEIMNGYYKTANDDIQFVAKPSNEDEVVLPLHRTSSSVRELSDLYFFLRNDDNRYNLLIIDEPESHLDTANQIRMARLLVRAVNTGLKVLITTHSDYIIKEINNLIMIHNLENNLGRKVARKHGYASGDSIDPAKIRAYVAENNSLTRCEIDQYGLNMPVFENTIDSINRVANDLASRTAVEADD